MAYSFKKWFEFGFYHGILVAVLVALAFVTIGVLGGVLLKNLVPKFGAAIELIGWLAALAILLMSPIVGVVSGALYYGIPSWILNYLDVRAVGYKAVMLVVVFGTLFWNAIDGLLSLMFPPSVIQETNPIVSIIVQIVGNAVVASATYLIWTKVLKKSEEELSLS